MNNNVNVLKKVIAIALCFCFIALSSFSFQVDASVDKGYLKRAKSYLKKHYYTVSKGEYKPRKTTYSVLIGSSLDGLKMVDIYFTKNTKGTNHSYNKLLKTFGDISINVKQNQNINLKQLSKKSFRVTYKYDGKWNIVVIKKDTRKKRVFRYTRWNVSKKRIKRTIKKQLKFINRLNKL